MHTIRFWLLLLLLAEAAIGPGVVAQGEDVPSAGDTDVVIASFIVRPYDTEVVAYASTDVGYTLQNYYDGGGDMVLSGGSNSYYGHLGQGGFVDGTLTMSLGAGDFTVTASHYVIPIDPVDSSGTMQYNPYFSGDWSTASCTIGDGQSSLDSCKDVQTSGFDETAEAPPDQIDIGTTSDQVSVAPPVIYSITADASGSTAGGVTVGSTGTLDIVGAALTASGSDMHPTVNVTPTSGLTWQNVVVVDDGHLQLTGYSAGTVGTYQFTVTTGAGTSSPPYTFTVGDPQPVITSVCASVPGGQSCTPNDWQASWGQFSVTIIGKGFGTSPQLSISDGGFVSAMLISSTDDGTTASISASVTIASNTPASQAQITVTSQGYGGCGGGSCFVKTYSGESPTGTASVDVDPAPLQILFYGQNIANNATNPAAVVVGQRIALTASQGGSPIVPDNWSQPTGTVVSGYTLSSYDLNNVPHQGNKVDFPNPKGVPGDCQSSLTQNCVVFYWVTPSAPNAPWQVSYTYNGQTVRASFNVTGPIGVQVTGPTGVPDIFQNSTYGPTAGFVLLVNDGIYLTEKATNPGGGSFLWVQLLTAETWTTREGGPNSGTGVVGCIPTSFANDPSPELDNQFPYGTGYTFEDAPKSYGLGPSQAGDVAGEEKVSESFSIFLMWQPNLAGSIPVPLGSVDWQWACDAVNALTNQSNNTTWIRACAAPQTKGSAQFNLGPSWPQWHKITENGFIPQTCHYQSQ